jgi:hypothetical protein
MTRLVSVLILCLFACAPTSRSAGAAILHVTYTGTVLSGTDQNGIFGGATIGSAAPTYLGTSFTLVHTIDTTVVPITTGADFFMFEGGNSNPSPISSALTINGITVSLFGTGQGYHFNQLRPTPPLNRTQQQVIDRTGVLGTPGSTDFLIFSEARITNGTVLFPLDPLSPFGPYAIAGALTAQVEFSATVFQANGVRLDTDLFMNETSVSLTVADAAAVPLPPALALFAIGLAGLGWLTCRKKKQVA